MYNLLTQNPTAAKIFIVAVIVVALFLFVKAMQSVGMSKIRDYVYELFEKAERKFKHGDNTEKFEYVIGLAKSAIPLPFSLFITESLLRKVVQAWFNVCKDLLDDGQFNGTGKDGKNNE